MPVNRKRGLLFAVFAAAAIALVACANSDAEFKLGWTFETNRIVTVTGMANQHVGGETSNFNVDLDNQDTVRWRAPYCLVIVDEQAPVEVFFRGEIDLAPGERTSLTAAGVFPEGPVGQVYGLRFVIPGEPQTNPASIWSGNIDLQGRKTWPEVADCSGP